MNAELMNGRNAIHYAADYGQTEIVKLLVEKGADVNVSNIQYTMYHKGPIVP